MRPEGVEPSTFWSEVRRSIQLSYERTNTNLKLMKNKTIKILSTSSDIGKRIDIFLSDKLNEFTRSNIKKIINLKNILSGD